MWGLTARTATPIKENSKRGGQGRREMKTTGRVTSGSQPTLMTQEHSHSPSEGGDTTRANGILGTMPKEHTTHGGDHLERPITQWTVQRTVYACMASHMPGHVMRHP